LSPRGAMTPPKQGSLQCTRSMTFIEWSRWLPAGNARPVVFFNVRRTSPIPATSRTNSDRLWRDAGSRPRLVGDFGALPRKKKKKNKKKKKKTNLFFFSTSPRLRCHASLSHRDLGGRGAPSATRKWLTRIRLPPPPPCASASTCAPLTPRGHLVASDR